MNEQKRIDMKVSHQLAEAYWDYLETFHEGAPISRRVLFEEAFSFVLANKIDYRSVMRFRAKRRITPDLPDKIHFDMSMDIFQRTYDKMYKHIPRMCNSIPFMLTIALKARLYYWQLELISDDGLLSGKTRNDNYMYAVKKGIRVDSSILDDDPLRGIYGVFLDDDCIYVAKSEDIFESLFVNDCYMNRIRHGCVDKKIVNAMNRGAKASISVLEMIKFDSDKHPLVQHLEMMERECFWKKYFIETNKSFQIPMGIDI